MGILEGEWMVWGSVASAMVLMLLFAYLSHFKNSTFDYALQHRSRLLSPGEQNFYECLISALGDDYYIFTKVAMLDVVEPEKAAGFFEQRKIRKRLSSECLSYLVCRKRDLSIFGVVDVENFDKRISAREQAEREQLVDAVCKSANLRVFYFDICKDYQAVDIQRLVTGRRSKSSHSQTSDLSNSHQTIEKSSYPEYATQRSCPQCDGEVVTKVALKGEHIGKKFLMCRSYPLCDYRVAFSAKRPIQRVRQAANVKIAMPKIRDPEAGQRVR